MLDIDHFKHCNDTNGHAAGDLVLAGVSRIILSGLRPTDIGLRYGGEEFLVILPDTLCDGARRVAERLRKMVEHLVVTTIDDYRIDSITISAGVAQREVNEDSAHLLSRADTLLYRAKEQGRNRVEW